MSSGGRAARVLIIDFSGIDGTLVVAEAPASMSQDMVSLTAINIFDKVQKEYDDDYATYADGRFDTLEAIKKHLAAVGATVITYEQERYL